MTLEEIKQAIENAIPESQVVVRDLGGGDHLEALIVSDSFAGKNRVQRHKQVYKALGSAMESRIHALAIKAWTSEEFKKSAAN